jgi:hypothetical protein
MGYTHYWYRPLEMDAGAFTRAVADCRKVCGVLPIPLGDSGGDGEPEFSNEAVCFNGHTQSGGLMPQVARVDGLLWPTRKAEGIAGWSDTERPEAGVWCAGPAVSTRTLPESGNGSYETFAVVRETEPRTWGKPCGGGLWFDCCKTNYRPYDLSVQCCLIVFAEHFGTRFLVSSDGESEAWNEARDICQHVLGYGLLFDLSATPPDDPEPSKPVEAIPDVPGLIHGSDLTVAAKNIRTELKRAFPRVQFSVRSKRFAGGDSINVHWTDGPTSKAVEAIIDKYSDGDFDGMTDSYNYRRDGWTQKYGGAKYVHANRHHSPEMTQRAIDALAMRYGCAQPPTVADYENGRTWDTSPLSGTNGERHWCWQSLIGRELAELTA